MMKKRFLILLISFLLSIWFLTASIIEYEESRMDSLNTPPWAHSLKFQSSFSSDRISIAKDPIMGVMGNETLKAQLGRSAWTLLHTMVGKFPNQPTNEESKSLSDFIYLFARLYPCGDCAKHFQSILERNPPQVNSRTEAMEWACKVHNVVNKRLKKPLFDCKKVSDRWKCGCSEDDLNNPNDLSNSHVVSGSFDEN